MEELKVAKIQESEIDWSLFNVENDESSNNVNLFKQLQPVTVNVLDAVNIMYFLQYNVKGFNITNYKDFENVNVYCDKNLFIKLQEICLGKIDMFYSNVVNRITKITHEPLVIHLVENLPSNSAVFLSLNNKPNIQLAENNNKAYCIIDINNSLMINFLNK